MISLMQKKPSLFQETERNMSKPTRLARKVLTEISEGNDALDSLYCLLEILENKLDPDMTEIHIVSTIYQIQEKIKLLENHLSKYSKSETDKLEGNKLSELYENRSKYGTSKFFKD